MEQFPHLIFSQKITGKPRLPRSGPNDRTEFNKLNRQTHSNNLSYQIANIKSDWDDTITKRKEDNLPILDEHIRPIFLQINPGLLSTNVDLQSFGIEIISEEEDGFIIGASLDAFISLEEKIAGFITKAHGTGKIADFWQIISGNREEWKPKHILSEELFQKWQHINDDEIYKIEVSIAFDTPIKKEPNPNTAGYEKKLGEYRKLQIQRDEKLMSREDHFDEFISYNGTRVSEFVHLEDSFASEVEITGKGLKDLVFNYPFVFEVAEVERISGVDKSVDVGLDFELEINPPESDAPEIGVIDSGIMENHKYLASAIKTGNSKSYLYSDNSTADYVEGGGHGTKVAGAILYPDGVTHLTTAYRLPCFIRNLRVLNKDNEFDENLFPALLMQTIVEDNRDCSIFNLSINSSAPFRKKHMSSWAATIDSLIHKDNILFIISAGNISKSYINYFLNNGETYPQYLHNNYCRVANPGQSSFALTVGSINHSDFEDDNWQSLGRIGNISAFSRIGTGIWGTIKPDVVEFGGGLTVSKNGLNSIRQNESTSLELLRSTLYGGNAYGKDRVGTSFATPRVTHIVAQLKKLYPEENINLLRALLVQGARLPNEHFDSPTTESIQFFGYGIPSLERVTKNSEQRISFYNTGTIKAEEGHIYSLKIPEQLRNQGDEYDILIEVTLAYTASVRRTRQKTKSYLSTWLDWTTSKIDESFDDFKDYTLKEIEDKVTEYVSASRKRLTDYPWKIRERAIWGEVEEINRNNSTVQKDWAIIKSYQLSGEINFAVRGHKGWDKNHNEIPYALVVSIEILNANVPIYEAIRIENEVEQSV